jgi:uncharacterized membrane protein
MNKTLLRAALAGILAAAISHDAEAHKPPKPPGKEKCYGVARAHRNDCTNASHTHTCSGRAKTDDDPGEWKYVDEGKCEALGGSLTRPGREQGTQDDEAHGA